MTSSTGRPAAGGPEEAATVEARVRALRDEMVRTAEWLEAGPAVRPAEIRERLLPRCEALAGWDLAREIGLVRAQLDAMFERVQRLAAAHPGAVPADSLGLPADARFLRDMADYLSQLLGPDPRDATG